MKTTILFLLASMLFCGAAQSQSKFMNGWEFLEWGMTTPQVEKLLSKNGISYTPLTPNARFRATKAQNYKGFDRLVFVYDAGALVQVQLYHQTNNRSEASRFVDAIVEDYTQTFGQPLSEDNSDSNKLSWAWQVGNSSVQVYLSSLPAEEGGVYETQVFYEKGK